MHVETLTPVLELGEEWGWGEAGEWVGGACIPSLLRGLWFDADVRTSHIPNTTSTERRIYDCTTVA